LGTIVADIFHEVDEEVRREQLKKLWDRYSIYLIALALDRRRHGWLARVRILGCEEGCCRGRGI
jgi:hypothetical protein